MLNKKGITLVELMAAIAIVGILSGIAIMSVTKYQEKTRKEVYKNHETNLKDGVINYFTSNTSEIKTGRVNASLLLEKGYIEEMVDPMDKSKKCINNSYVDVAVNGNIQNNTNNPNITYDSNGNMIIDSSTIKNVDIDYKVCLKCSQYQSKDCNS